MGTTYHCKQLATVLIRVMGIFALSSTALATQDVEESDNAEPQNVRVIEEITVRADRSFFLLRAQLEFAKEKLYSTYNDFNEDDEQDVNCKQTDWTSTRIQEQQCWPVFFEKLVAENTQAALRGEDILMTIRQLERRTTKEFEQLRANIERVAIENPEVAESLIELSELEQDYKRQREECMKKPAFLLILRRCP